MSEKKTKVINLKVLKGIIVVFVVGMVGFNSVQLMNMNKVVERVDKYNQGVVDEIGQFRGGVKMFADDLNEIREFLLLPVKNYDAGHDSAEVALEKPKDEQASSENQLAIYAFLADEAKQEKIAANKLVVEKAWLEMWADESNKNKITALNVSIQLAEKNGLQVKFIDNLAKNSDGTDNVIKGQPLFGMVYSPEENLFKWQSVLGDENLEFVIGPEGKTQFIAKIIDLITKKSQEVRVKKIALNAEKEALAKVDVAKDLLEAQKKQLESIFKEAAFQDTLSQAGLKLATASRNDDNKIIYDVLDATGKVKYAFVLEISSGLVKVLKDNKEIDLKTFLNSDGSKKKP